MELQHGKKNINYILGLIVDALCCFPANGNVIVSKVLKRMHTFTQQHTFVNNEELDFKLYSPNEDVVFSNYTKYHIWDCKVLEEPTNPKSIEVKSAPLKKNNIFKG